MRRRLSCLLAGCAASQPFVAPQPRMFDGRYVGRLTALDFKCSNSVDRYVQIVRDNQVLVRVVVSTDQIPIDASGAFTGAASMMRVAGTIVDAHMKMDLIGTECRYHFEADRFS